MPRSASIVVGGAVAFALALPAAVAAADGGRTSYGKPDLSGTYDTATLTPFTRNPAHGDRLYMTREEAAKIAAEEAEYIASRNSPTDPDREAPPEGGDGSTGASGNVGGYNAFWIDRGTDSFEIDGKFRTSILYDPANGQMPEPVRERSFGGARGSLRGNTGEAYWIGPTGDEPGPYDNPEQRGVAERCLLGFGSTAGPPALPALYNNHKRIVQTEDFVMILTEMVHDVRIVRMNAQHEPDEVRRWFGDPIGWWDGDTLVVETTNFVDRPSFSRGSRDMKVTERFSRTEDGDLIYDFTVEDPTVWKTAFSGEYPWRATGNRVYEYACAEGNYALGNILRGARILEAEAIEKLRSGSSGE